MYFLLVFFGALLFCACEKENIDPLIEDQAQVENQFEDGVLKAADLPELIEEPGTPLPFWARAGTGFPNLMRNWRNWREGMGASAGMTN